VVLALSAFPAPALAGDGGGTTAPTGPRTEAGGSSYDDGFAVAEQQRRIAVRERKRRAAVRERRAAARERERRAAARERLQRLAARERSRALDGDHVLPIAGPF
jgi:hypothetical protein